MGWTPPTKRSTLLDDIPQGGGYNIDPLALDYGKKSLEPGESVVFRILTFDGDGVQIPTRKCAVTYVSKDNNQSTYNDIQVPDPGHPHNQQIIDDGGVKMDERDSSKLYRTPVIYLYKCDKDMNIVEEFNEVRYLEYGPGVAKQLKELQDDVEDGLGFEAIPDYDIRLKITFENKIRNYEIKPVRKIKDENGKLITCPHFQQPFENCFGEEWLDHLGNVMPGLFDHLVDKAAEDMQPENVKKRFVRYREEKSDGAGKKGPAMASTPSRTRPAPAVASEEPEPETQEPEEKKPVASSAPGKGPSRFPALKPKS